MSDQSSNRPLTSKAVTYKALGGPEVIQFVERTVRAPAAGEVRIEVKAAAVNPADILFRDPGGGDKPAERGIKIKPMMVSGVLERTEWLELLRNMVAAGEIKLRVVEEYAPTKAADTQRALVAGSSGAAGNPLLASLPPCVGTTGATTTAI